MDRNLRKRISLSLCLLSSLFIVLASMCGNVRLQLTSSLWLHRRVQKGTVAAEEVGKTFPSLAAFGFAVVGHHKSFVFLISKHCHRGHGKGNSSVWRGCWGNWRSSALATRAASLWRSGWSTEGSGMAVASPTPRAHT